MDEYIKREPLLQAAKQVQGNLFDAPLIVDLIQNAPAEDVQEVRHGVWMFGEFDVIGTPVRCSNCGYMLRYVDPKRWLDYPLHKFCGACGAKMDGKGDTNAEVD